MGYMITRIHEYLDILHFCCKGYEKKRRYKFADSHGGCYSIDGRHIGCMHMSQ